MYIYIYIYIYILGGHMLPSGNKKFCRGRRKGASRARQQQTKGLRRA